MARICRYYGSCIRLALRGAAGRADLIAGFAGAAFAFLASRWPGVFGDGLAWQVTVAALLAVVVVRLVMSPYWRHQESERREAGLVAEIARVSDWRVAVKIAVLDDVSRNPGTYLAAIANRLNLMEATEGNVPLQIIDAVRSLEADGELETRAGKGIYVRSAGQRLGG